MIAIMLSSVVTQLLFPALPELVTCMAVYSWNAEKEPLSPLFPTSCLVFRVRTEVTAVFLEGNSS